MGNLVKVEFYKVKAGDKSTIDKLKSKGIIVEITPKDIDPKSGYALTLTQEPKEEIDLDDVVTGLKKFHDGRTGGKVLQMLGVIGLGAYFFMENNYRNEIKDGNLKAKPVKLGIPMAACAAITIGIVMDIGAGGHLKIKR